MRRCSVWICAFSLSWRTCSLPRLRLRPTGRVGLFRCHLWGHGPAMPGLLPNGHRGGWRYVEPFDGLQVWQRATGLMLRHNGGNWSAEISAASLRIGGQQVVGPRGASISEPSGGAVVDVECRARLTELIAALQTHGLISN